MASILKVDTIQDQDGNNIINESANTITIGASGDTITIPSGATLANSGIVTGFESTGIDDNATSTAITIDSSQRVGIGTTFPSHELDIQSSGDVTQQLKTTSSSNNVISYLDGGVNADSAYRFLGDGTTYYSLFRDGSQSQDLRLFSHTDTAGSTDILRYTINGDLRFGTNASEAMRIDSSGNVGIGTSSPGQKVAIAVDDSNTSIGNGNQNLELSNINGTNGTYSRILFNDTAGGAGAAILGVKLTDTTNNYGQFEFLTRGSSGVGTRMVIEPNGNVGIGTSSPSGSDFGSQTGLVHIKDVGGINTGIKLEQGAGKSFWYQNATNTFFGSGSSHPLRIYTGQTERMRIDSSGHVTKPYQPAVHAYSSSAQNNIATGIVTIQLDAEIYDVNSDFNTSTYTFTAPVTGKYLVTMNLVMSEVDTAFQWIYLLGVSSNRNYYLNVIDPRMLVQDGNWSWSGSSLVDMDANDTFIMKTRSSAHGAAQMDVVSGTATSPETQMTITLLS